MLRRVLDRVVGFVTQHTRITLLLLVLVTAGVVAGIPQLDTESQASASADAFDDIERVEKFQYVNARYGGNDSDRSNRSLAMLYVHDGDRNVLSKDALLGELRLQQSIRERPALESALHPDGIRGLSNLVARRAADEPDPDLATQIAAIEAASAEEVSSLVSAILDSNPLAGRYLSREHDGNAPTAHDRRLIVALDGSVDEATMSEATAVLYDAAQQRSASGYFTLGEHAQASFQSQTTTNLLELVVPLSLLLILFVLAFSYRDLVDIVVGMVGVVLSILWMLGLLGWLGVAAGTIVIVPIVLITGLSIDFGFHVFNRYREERADGDEIRPAMRRGVSLVATALLLVTATAAIGFLSNLANPLPVIRNLGVTITLGVVSALVIFTTIVPALKIGLDGLLERVGFDRRTTPLGHGQYLEPLLARSVTLARRAAPFVVVLAVLVGAAGGVAWTALEEENYQQSGSEVAEWKQQLPGPMGWEVHEYREHRAHVEEVYAPASDAAAIQSRLLIEGELTGDRTLERLQAGVAELSASEIVLDQAGTDPVRSPLTVMQRVAERDDGFATAFEAADTDGNGVPDRSLASLYDELYAADAEAASRVLERTDGEYRSMLLVISLEADYQDADAVVAALDEGAAAIEEGPGNRAVTLVGPIAVNAAVLAELTSGVLLTMLVALAAIVVGVSAVFRLTHGSASLGAVVAVPIALVLGLVIGSMYLLEIPLTLLTALLISLVIGLGIDYNIHIGDRFADELRAGSEVPAALRDAVTGTGGALLGSTLTSAGAFATIALVPNAQLQSFGVIVVLALVAAFLASVLVLPSILWLWGRRADTAALAATEQA